MTEYRSAEEMKECIREEMTECRRDDGVHKCKRNNGVHK